MDGDWLAEAEACEVDVMNATKNKINKSLTIRRFKPATFNIEVNRLTNITKTTYKNHHVIKPDESLHFADFQHFMFLNIGF